MDEIVITAHAAVRRVHFYLTHSRALPVLGQSPIERTSPLRCDADWSRRLGGGVGRRRRLRGRRTRRQRPVLAVLLRQLGAVGGEVVARLQVAAQRADAHVHGPVEDDVRFGRCRTAVVHLAQLEFGSDVAAAFHVLAGRLCSEATIALQLPSG